MPANVVPSTDGPHRVSGPHWLTGNATAGKFRESITGYQ